MLRMVSSTTPLQLDQDVKRVLIIGAGHTGIIVIKELRRHLNCVETCGFIDDDINTHGSQIIGVKVHGGHDKVQEITRRFDIDEIIFAIPNAPRKVQSAILNECKKTRCKLKILPSISSLINEDVTIKNIRDVQIEDLLGREPVNLDVDGICDYITNQVVLVTGGGSIGRDFAGRLPGTILSNYWFLIYMRIMHMNCSRTRWTSQLISRC